MVKIKIISNPYVRNISFMVFSMEKNSWIPLEMQNPDSKLRQENIDKVFLPFKAMEIVNIVLDEYYVGDEKVGIVFQGTTDEWNEMETICYSEEYREKVELIREGIFLENARDILALTKDVFEEVHPIITNIFREEDNSNEAIAIRREMKKVADSLDDIIPICVFGNYSAGKSTFINALIGNEILPSGGDPVTAKIYEIKQSKYQDRSVIAFQFKEGEEWVSYRVVFDLKECRIQEGNKESEVATELTGVANEQGRTTMLSKVRGVVEYLNFKEKQTKDTVISNVIEIEVPFCERGKLGQSHNEFVIFDTPGSNSATNIDHGQVLKESLESFSNGIPVWVTQYDSIDSVDNAKLCEMLYKIDALDKRFTMIVINKADSAELPRNGLSQEEVQNILEFDSVSRMYAGGIYFVSSIMGLGAKNPDEMASDFLQEVFEEKERKFSDPNARAYKKLYEYNIMPIQMKELAVDYSLACDNRIYANSGLYCVETEMEQFASKYAAYNKCHSAYAFLQSITNTTREKIDSKTNVLEKRKKKQELELGVQQRELIAKVNTRTIELVESFKVGSRAKMRDYAKTKLSYDLLEEDIKKKDQDLNDENLADANYKSHEDAYERAKSSRLANLRANLKKAMTIKEGLVDTVKSMGASIKESVTDWRSDGRIVKEKKKSMDDVRRDIDKMTSDEILNEIVEKYKKNRADAFERISNNTKNYWNECSIKYREEMVQLIESTEALTEEQKADASEAVSNYQTLVYDDSEKVFMKARLLKGNILGFHIGSSERLDTEKLVDRYNDQMKNVIANLSNEINHECFVSYEKWQGSLKSMVEANIAKLNPDLHELTISIQEDEERIRDLRNDQEKIVSSVAAINDLMAWKTL